MCPGQFDPGEKIPKKEVYEVWGDIILNCANMNTQFVDWTYEFVSNSDLPKPIICQRLSTKSDNRPFLTLEWDNIIAHIDACPFGKHLNVYAILALRRGLTDSADPNERIANLDAIERRNLQVFQTFLRFAITQSLEKLDEGKTS